MTAGGTSLVVSSAARATLATSKQKLNNQRLKQIPIAPFDTLPNAPLIFCQRYLQRRQSSQPAPSPTAPPAATTPATVATPKSASSSADRATQDCQTTSRRPRYHASRRTAPRSSLCCLCSNAAQSPPVPL